MSKKPTKKAPNDSLKAKTPVEKKEAPVLVPEVFAKNYYLPGFGHIKEGDMVTQEIMDCWNKVSKGIPATNKK